MPVIAPLTKLQRTVGEARLAVRCRSGRNQISEFYQSGAAKMRVPNGQPGATPEVVLLNTAGGLTGGDRFAVSVTVEDTSEAVVTTQACERIYRSRGDNAVIDNRLVVGAGATLAWLPQETILFDRSQLRRSLRADIAAGGRAIMVESILFGRSAMGETVETGLLRDDWTIYLDGRLAFADRTSLTGKINEVLNRNAVAAGQKAMATIVYVGDNMTALRDAVRARGRDLNCAVGATIVGGVLVSRMLAETGARLRGLLEALMFILRGGAALPRVWSC